MHKLHGGEGIFFLSSLLRFWSESEVAFKDKALNCQTCGRGTFHRSVHMIAGYWVVVVLF